MAVETDVRDALNRQEPLERLQALVRAARRVDELRSEVARLKGLAAADCANAQVPRKVMADASGVTVMAIEQWVKRGRDELAARG